MPTAAEPQPMLLRIKTDDFSMTGLEDEIRVENACIDLLRHLFQAFTTEKGLESGQAGELCHGADYFLREFIIADRKENLFTIDPLRVRQFAGHWYIIRTMEPNLTELQSILAGTSAFYSFLATQGLFSVQLAAEIEGHCLDTPWHQQRIEDFWALEGDGYTAWRQTCPLESVPDWP